MVTFPSLGHGALYRPSFTVFSDRVKTKYLFVSSQSGRGFIYLLIKQTDVQNGPIQTTSCPRRQEDRSLRADGGHGGRQPGCWTNLESLVHKYCSSTAVVHFQKNHMKKYCEVLLQYTSCHCVQGLSQPTHTHTHIFNSISIIFFTLTNYIFFVLFASPFWLDACDWTPAAVQMKDHRSLTFEQQGEIKAS